MWSNPNPSNDFGSSTVTLSNDMNNYTWLKFTYKKDKTTSDVYSVIYQVSDVKQFVDSSGQKVGTMAIGRNSAYNLVRVITYVSDTKITIGTSLRINNAAATNNEMVIPLVIYGMK